MERWKDRVAAVTGAGSGIGAAVAKDLVNSGMVVVGLGRRVERIAEIRDSLPADLQSRMHLLKCDVSSEESVKTAFAWIEKNLGGVDVLVHSAAIFHGGLKITDSESSAIMRAAIDTNIAGAMWCAREAFQSMKKRHFDGHIVMLNSVLGHHIVNFMHGLPSVSMFGVTKFAITAMVETLRQELFLAGTKIKITSISPGSTDTEILPKEAKEMGFPMLDPEDVSNAIHFVLATPPHVQVCELKIKPVREAY